MPTRSDQCRAGPGEDKRTAAQQSRNKGLDRIRNIPARTRSMLRFHAGKRFDERLKVVVTMVRAPTAYKAEALTFGGAPGPLITRLSELRWYSARLRQARALIARRTRSLLVRLVPK